MAITTTTCTPTAQDWAEALRAVAEHRDRQAFIRIYDHFSPRLHRYLTGLGVSSSRAEELTQETLLKLWLKADTFNPALAGLSTWLFRIARNLYINSLRKQEVGLVSMHDSLDTFDVADETDSGVDEDRERRLQSAMADLPENQLRVIQMSYLQTKSHGQIAEELGMPLGTVKSNIRRAFAKLRAIVGE